jgi:two-component system, NtrC family, sensor kinase
MIFYPGKKLKTAFVAILNIIYHWSIAQKISYGYATAIGIAIVGTINGLAIASYYERVSQEQVSLSSQQQNFLKNLELKVISLRIHPQKLISVLENTVWLEFEQNQFLNEIDSINKNLSQFKVFINNYPSSLAINDKDFTLLLNRYTNNIKLYNQKIRSFWFQLSSINVLSKKQKKSSQDKLFLLLKDQEFIDINVKFEKLADELSLINQRAKYQEQQANNNFNNAQNLRIKIIIGSVILSSLVAGLLAWYTSRAIARPITAIANIAKRIIQESNFEIRANVTVNNEVGTLAASLNQLIQWVGDYTLQLEIARQTLEKKVEERTIELQQAHQNLEKKVEERTIELQQVLQDLKEAQSLVIQTEKLSSLGAMVAGIAHEINNPINFIYGNIQYADSYFQEILSVVELYEQLYPDGNPVIKNKLEELDWEYLVQDLSKLLSSMKTGAERIREIVLSLRNFSRLDEAEIKEVDIHEGINNTLLILNHRLQQDIKVMTDYGNLPLIECYPAKLNQVFVNIINNSIDAVLEMHALANKQICIKTETLNENSIQISIKDNGIGIPEEIMHKLFDPFFTTKPVGKGTGLGLSISYKIIETHQGRIEVLSEVGKGTEFKIAIPVKLPLCMTMPRV